MQTLGDGAVMPSYHHPRLFTGHPTLDRILTVWYGACTRSGPPRWEDMRDLMWQGQTLQPWCVHLVLAESRHRMKPARCAEVYPVAAMMLGLPLFFAGVLPMDNPRAAKLSAFTSLVCRGRRIAFKKLPEKTRADGTVSRPLVIGLPLVPVPLQLSLPPYRIERVLFAIAHARRESATACCG
jgi:hypothetical protein